MSDWRDLAHAKSVRGQPAMIRASVCLRPNTQNFFLAVPTLATMLLVVTECARPFSTSLEILAGWAASPLSLPWSPTVVPKRQLASLACPSTLAGGDGLWTLGSRSVHLSSRYMRGPHTHPHPRSSHTLVHGRCDVSAYSVLPARVCQLIKWQSSLDFATAIDPYTSSSLDNTHSGNIMTSSPTYNTTISQQQQQQHNYQHLSYIDHSQQNQDETDLVDEIPALDFDSPETYQLLQTNLDSLQAFNGSSIHPMQSDSWGGLAQLTPKIGRFSHQRESSLSSLGSTGPASPYTQNTSNPHIAISDTTFEGLPEMHSQDYTNNQATSYYQLAKSMGPASYTTYHNLDGNMPEMAYPVTVSGPGNRPRLDKGLLPAHELIGAYSRSHPASVASSAAGDSPATPAFGETDHKRRRKNGRTQYAANSSPPADADLMSDLLDYGHVPKLDRTMTDVYGDELYNPNFTITSASSPQPTSVASTGSEMFSQRINAANSQHLSAAHSPASTTSRARSPFRTGSPFAASSAHNFGSSQPPREHDQNTQRPMPQLESVGEPETPKTISPKDAVLEFNESEADGLFPLFPQDSANFEINSLSKAITSSDPEAPYLGPNAVNLHSNDQFAYLPSQMPSGIQVPQQYPFIARPPTSHDTPPRLSSSGASSIASGANTPAARTRPTSTGAEGGTYTCTYHGCTLRFETPTLLQKHKREGHRQTQNLGAPRVQDMGMTSTLLNTQSGPHRCDRINPSTGKPCSTVFSRPYDLTRHEDTIHNARKQKVRCNLCTEEKTFSRADALTRHYRVCHPDMELPGKNRRRG